MSRSARQLATRVVPVRARDWLRQRGLTQWPPVGRVRLGSLRRLQPIDRWYGFTRGLPIDRFYVETFLQQTAGDIRGHVLEIGEDLYTRKFGQGVTAVDILDIDPGNPNATIVADLSRADHLEGDRFDCIICTQTLLLIYDVPAALATLARLLKPGGVLLATVPGISKICRVEADSWGDYWRFTTYSLRRLATDAFPEGEVAVQSYGNVLAAVGFLHGLAVGDVRPEQLERHDPDYEVIVALRAVKPVTTQR